MIACRSKVHSASVIVHVVAEHLIGGTDETFDIPTSRNTSRRRCLRGGKARRCSPRRAVLPALGFCGSIKTSSATQGTTAAISAKNTSHFVRFFLAA
jgi:hypothetical protein